MIVFGIGLIPFSSVKRLSKHLPIDNNWKHFVRYGEFKAVVPVDGSPMLLYGPAENIICEFKDVSKKSPDIVKKIKAFLKENKISRQRVNTN